MSYVPKKEQDELERLKKERDQTRLQLKKDRERLNTNTGLMWLFLIILILSVGYTVYGTLYGLPFEYRLDGGGKGQPAMVDSLENRLVRLQEEMEEERFRAERSNQSRADRLSQGKWYLVQIGAYEKLDLGLYEEGFQNFTMRELDRLHKYTLGAFTSLDRADEFCEKVRKMGVRDAFVVGIEDGERIELDEERKEQKK